MRLGSNRREEGQVTPALLVAVSGALALAVGLISLQVLSDQTGRADTASDAAALAVGREHQEAILSIFDGNSGLHLGQLANLILSPGETVNADEVAEEFAAANGATAEDVDLTGFDPSSTLPEWRYAVTTQQADEIEGGGKTVQIESTSTVEVRITSGLCRPKDDEGGLGLELEGGCASPELLKNLCELDLNPPSTEAPSPTDAPTGTGPPVTEPPVFEPPDGFEPECVNPRDFIDWEVRLVSN